MIKVIGDHKVTNASIEDPIVDRMLAGEKVNIFCSDPPWGDGNLKYWATMNRKMSGREFTPINYETLIGRIRELITRYVDGHVLLDTGIRWEQQTIEMLVPVVHRIRSFRVRYRSGSRMLECVTLAGVTDPSYPDMPFDPTGMHGYEVPRRCVQSVATPGGIVFDPCCGMGYAAKAAVASGMRFRGNEFNPVRLAKTIKFLERVTR